MSSARAVIVSAPSKLILHGEHSVVYGKTALAASLDLRTTIKLCASDDNTISVDFPDIGVKQNWSLIDISKLLSHRPEDLIKFDQNGLTVLQTDAVDEKYLGQIRLFLSDANCDEVTLKSASLLCFFYLYSLLCKEPLSLKILVESQIPIGAGLGSSAALSVCLAAGLLKIQNDDFTNDLICRLAFVSEKILHGNPSGIDNSVSTFGGFIKFSDFKPTVVEFAPPIKVLLVNTQVKRNTKTLVEKVAKQFQDHPTVVKPILDSIDGISKSCLATLELFKDQNLESKPVYERLGSLIDYNQKLLEALQVSHPKIDEIVRVSSSLGLHAKLTGAGGGGFAFILIPPFVKLDIVEQAKDLLTKHGMICCETTLGVEGVKIDIS